MKKSCLIINQIKEALPELVIGAIEKEGLELAGTVPADQLIYEFDLKGTPTMDLPEDSPSLKAAFDIFDKIIDA